MADRVRKRATDRRKDRGRERADRERGGREREGEKEREYITEHVRN